MILAIDFDGVIHDKAHPVPGRRMGMPLPDSKAAVSALYNSGHQIIIFTVMATSDGGCKAVEAWMKYYKIPFHEVTAVKPNADWFVDDHAVRHWDWATTMSQIHAD